MRIRSSRRRAVCLVAAVVCALASLTSGGPAVAAPSEGASSARAHDGRHVLVAFKPQAAGEARAAAHAAQGTGVVNRMEWLNLDVVAVPDGQTPEEVAARYERNPNVRAAEPNWAVSIAAEPDDPLFPSMWGLHNEGNSYFGGIADADIDAPEAWDLAYPTGFPASSSGYRVGILDTGIDRTHEELSGKTVACARATTGLGIVTEGDCYDDHGHGTHVAGTIAAATNNGVGIAGIAPDVDLAVFKFLDWDGGGYLADAIAGLRWMHTVGNAKVVNNSWGTSFFVYGSTLDLAIMEADAAGVFLIAAAGNGYCKDPWLPTDCYSYPAGHPLVMSVAASTPWDQDAWFSNCNDDVEIAAPGTDIYSSLPGNYYQAWSGTSMATPHVVGAAALLMSKHGLTKDETRARLKETADDIGAAGPDYCTGAGRLNLFRSLGGTVTPPPVPGRITGTVANQAKAGIADAFVECSVNGHYYWAWTDPSGNYTIEQVTPESYSCTASHYQYQSKTQKVMVLSGQTTTSNFTLRKTSNGKPR